MKRLLIALSVALSVALSGVALMLPGLGVDAWLHARDATLAEREGIFTLTNPGHALLFAGVVMITGGVIAAFYITWGMVLHGRVLRTASLVATSVAALGAIVFAAAIVSDGEGHTHDEPQSTVAAAHAHDDAATPHDEPAQAAAQDDAGDTPAAAGAPAPHMEGDHPHPEPVVATPEQIACGHDLVDRTREAIARFEDFAIAVAEGYVASEDKPDATHFRNAAYHRDGNILHLANPESLVYFTRPDGTKVLRGALYKSAPGQPGPTRAALSPDGTPTRPAASPTAARARW